MTYGRWNDQLLEKRAGCLAAVLAVVGFIGAGAVAYCTEGCTPAERQTLANDARWADTNLVIPFTDAVCEVETSTAPPAGWVDLLCSFAEGIEARIAEPPADAGSSLAAGNVKAPATLRMRLTIPRARQLAAAHPEVLTLPKGL